MKRQQAAVLLAWLLRIGGASMLLAVGPMFMPTAWIHAAHRALGLGTFPRAPIAEYLARLSSGMYALLGGLLVCLSVDVVRYRGVILYAALALAAVTIGANVEARLAGMPWWWVLGDGITATGYSVLIVLLLTRTGPGSERPDERPGSVNR